MSKSQITGLSLQGGEIQLATVRRARGSAKLVDSRAVPLSGGTGSDSSEDAAAVAAQLKSLKSRMPGSIAVGLPSDQVLMRVIELPALDADELDSMVDLQIDRLSPFPSESTVTSYEVLSQTDTSSRVLVVITQSSVVDAIGDTLKMAGITPHRLDMDVLGMWRLMSDAGTTPSAGHHIALLMGSTVDVIVAANGIPIMLRSLGAAQELNADDIISEIDYTLTTLEAEHGIERISSAAVWHSGAVDPTLIPELAERTGIQPEEKAFDTLPSVAEGLARRAADQDSKRVDLAPDEWMMGERRIRARRKLAALSVLLLLVWAGAVGGLFAGLQLQNQKILSMEAELDGLKTPSQEARELRGMVLRAEQYTNRTHSALECLREVTIVKPREIEFRLFKYAGTKDRTVTIQGESTVPNAVLDFENSLDKSKLFSSVKLIGPKSTRGKHTFTITLKLSQGGI